MENVLRAGQERALLTTAQLLARAIATDNELVEQSLSDPSNAQRQHLFAVRLSSAPLLDGFADEWPLSARALPTDGEVGNLRLGIYGGALYGFIHVPDAQVRYEVPGTDDRPTKPSGDRVLIATKDQSGVGRAWSISAVAPGPVIVRRTNAAFPWQATTIEEPDIRGTWRATRDGFDLELRIPQRMVGAEIAFAHLDDGALPENIPFHELRAASEALHDKLALYAPEGVRLSVIDPQGWLLANAGSLKPSLTELDAAPDFYRWLLGRSEQAAPTYGLPYGMWGPPVDAARAGESGAIWFQATGGEPSTVRAAVPIRNNNSVVGVIAVEQAGGQLLRERDTALAQLLRFTVLATLAVVVVALFFAAWLSRRIRRLSLAAASALGPKGDVNAKLPETTARDELGDLARSYATLLQRVQEYTQYLRTLGSKLSHEFRTPLAIISSSLENLAVEKNPHGETYVQRARDGAARLQGILTAMTEATRVEQSIDAAERVSFDIADLIRGVGQAYAQTFASHRLEVIVAAGPCPLTGAPELIVQMLDKLVDNAVDFCPPSGRITIELAQDPKEYILSVNNEGPLLAPDTEGSMFDMLVSNRTPNGAKPHLGLGLFIVQAIARFHGGHASGRNLRNLNGVCFEVRLPKP